MDRLNSNSAFYGENATNDLGLYLYNTSDTKAYFIFRYLWINGAYQIQVLAQPNYYGRPSNPDTTWKAVGNPNYTEIIDLSERIQSLNAIKQYSKHWAEFTWFYIQTGTSPDDQVQSNTEHFYGRFILPSELFNRTLFLYRVEDGQGFFIYEFVETKGYYEMDILAQPGYALRNPNHHITHKLYSSKNINFEKICITQGYEPKTLDLAKNIAQEWSELTWNYIKTGVSLDQQIKNRTPRNDASRQPGGVGGRPSRPASWFQRIIDRLFN